MLHPSDSEAECVTHSASLSERGVHTSQPLSERCVTHSASGTEMGVTHLSQCLRGV